MGAIFGTACGQTTAPLFTLMGFPAKKKPTPDGDRGREADKKGSNNRTRDRVKVWACVILVCFFYLFFYSPYPPK